MNLDKKLRRLAEYKRPDYQKANYLGIEVEFISPWLRETLKLQLVNLGLEKHCNLIGDGSISIYDSGDQYNDDYDEDDDNTPPEEAGHELRILCKESELRTILPKLSIFFTKCHARVNKSCGLHVHLDMRNRNYILAGQNLLDSIDEIESLTPVYRFDGEFCRLPKATTRYNNVTRRFEPPTVINVDTVAAMGKYQAVNISAYHNKKTIEVRTHEGTINTTEIYNWCRYLISKVNKRSLPGVKQYVEKRKQQVA